MLGNLTPADFLNKEFSVEGTLEAIWQNESRLQDARSWGPPRSRSASTSRTPMSRSAARPTRRSIIDMPKCTIQELGRPLKVKDLIYQTIKFKASYSVSDTLIRPRCA